MQLIVKLSSQNHSSNFTQGVFDLVEVLTFDGYHTLLKFEGLLPIIDRKVIGAVS